MPDPGKIDGYAVQNTAHVLCALRAHEIKRRTGSSAEATQAAIDSYAALSQRRVTGRCVRRWLGVVKGYGGIEKTPENAFGARKSCPHVRRPTRIRLRAIKTEAELLLARTIKGKLPSTARLAAELALLDRDLSACVLQTQADPARLYLASIRRTAQRLGNMPIHRLYERMSPQELDQALDGVLARIKALSSKPTGKVN